MLLAALALFGPAARSFGAGFGVGLYKDGKLVEEFAAPIELPDPVEQARAAAGDPVAIAKGKARESAAKVQGAELSEQTKERNAALARAAKTAVELREFLREVKARKPADQDAVRQKLRRLERELTDAHADVQQALTRAEVRILSARLDPIILERHDKTVDAIEEGHQRLVSSLRQLIAGNKKALDEVLSVADQMVPANQPDLTRLPPTLQRDLQQAPALTREQADALLAKTSGLAAAAKAPGALAVAPASLPGPGDLAATVEVQLTAEIVSKAAALGNSPRAIYEFVRNSVAFQPYLGSRKGGVETLHQLHGNDTDQASLLLALLRAAGIPSRYVRGTVEMTPERAKSWLGVDDAATAGSILTTAGMDGVNIISGAAVTAIRCTRVWVEAYVPYSNYRGVPNESTGNAWVPLDPAFKQTAVTPGQDVLAAMGYNNDVFLANYISTFHSLSPIEKLVADIQTWLSANQPGTTEQQVERLAALSPQSLGLLPASLPFDVRTVSSRFSELEDSKRYKVSFQLYNGATSFIDYSTNLSQIAGHRVNIDYIGATPVDQAVIDAHGGIFETPPNLVNLKPRLKLDGAVLVTSTNSIGMGRTHSSDLRFTQPTGASNVQPLVQNSITAGNTQAIGFDTFLDANDATLFGTSGTSLLESLLFSNAVTYLNRVDRGQEKAEALLRMVSTQDVSEAIVESAVAVTTSFGVPVTFSATGLIVDADRRIVGPFQVNGDHSKEIPYMLLTGYDGSIMENRLFEDTYDQPAVSTVKILELASDQGIPVYRIVTSIAADAPGLSQPASVVSAINAALAQGHVVIIPRTPITVTNWSGTGYIDLTPTTGAAGYIISGGIGSGVSTNGGATVVQTWSKALSCAATSVTCEVNKPSADSPAAGAVFGATDTNPLKFEVTLHITCKDGSMSDVPWKFQTTSSAKGIADNPSFGPGDYTLTVSALGSSQCMRKITIVKVEFKKDKDCAGFDDTLTPPWIMAPVSGTNKAKCVITPATAASAIDFETVDSSKATVSPANASASPEAVTVAGVAKGETEIRAKIAGGTTICAVLKVSAKMRLNKTVVINKITEENDDVQVIPVGKGQPDQICITAGANGVLNSTPAGDDTIVSTNITTGPDGICNSAKGGDDVQLIAVGKGKLNVICVTKGANNFRDTIPSGDDVVNGTSIDTGPDGIANTTANATNLVPANAPTKAALQQYLNGTIWGLQANVFFTVTESSSTVNYDLDRDGKLDDPYEGPPGTPKVPNDFSELNVVRGAKDTSVNYNIYYVKSYEFPIGLTIADEIFTEGRGANSIVNHTAHEVGHALGRSSESNNVEDVMYKFGVSANPCRVLKVDWDAVNP